MKPGYGYFSGGRFGTADGREITDEIALNPTHLRDRPIEGTLSTLVHEMTHLEQHHFGKPGRRGYHNKQWTAFMRAVGLIPSDTGNPGGKQTGERVSHYIEPAGHFDRACRNLLLQGFTIRYVELTDSGSRDGAEGGEAGASLRKIAGRMKYICPSCCLNAWGKPALYLLCGECGKRLKAAGAA